MNRRIEVASYGGEEVLKLVHEPLREPHPNELRIRVEGAGVALADIMRREGKYPNSPAVPFVPGYDAVGIVDRVGSDVGQYKEGDRAGVFYNGTGAYAEYVYEAADHVFRIPASVDAAEAVAIVLNYVTAYQMLHRLAQVSHGERILVHGAAGGVGSALLDLGRQLGLRMYGTASAAKHSVLTEFGALPIDYRKDDFVRVLAETVPGGIDAVFDPIGGEHWMRSFRTLGAEGRFIGYGYTSVLGHGQTAAWVSDWSSLAESGRTPQGHPAYLYSITGLRGTHPEWFLEDVALLMSWLEEGKLKPLVSHRIPLSRAAEAHRLLTSSNGNAAVGKIVLIPG
ncbi:medium chain dehydrogenase/reductase family protein [Paenibacillus chartarius]|uniref:Medium chain dehydrogenase/reductase family protein n=1 Tax=Paenibacillus chartarius TaxID=747481 RepID=A0ABV6DUF1_9BACL